MKCYIHHNNTYSIGNNNNSSNKPFKIGKPYNYVFDRFLVIVSTIDIKTDTLSKMEQRFCRH